MTRYATRTTEKKKNEKRQGGAPIDSQLPARDLPPLEQIAKQNKVSVGWVVRDAAEKYIAEQWPLLESLR